MPPFMLPVIINVKLLYVSPERLQNEQFKAFASELQIALVVVDEAHCVVRWG